MPRRSYPDLSGAVENVRFLMKAVEVVSSLSKMRRDLALSEKQEALAVAQREVSRWEERRQAQITACTDAAACSSRRCRRAGQCKALRWMAAQAVAAQARLAAARAALPAPEEEAPPRSRHKRPGDR